MLESLEVGEEEQRMAYPCLDEVYLQSAQSRKYEPALTIDSQKDKSARGDKGPNLLAH